MNVEPKTAKLSITNRQSANVIQPKR